MSRTSQPAASTPHLWIRVRVRVRVRIRVKVAWSVDPKASVTLRVPWLPVDTDLMFRGTFRVTVKFRIKVRIRVRVKVRPSGSRIGRYVTMISTGSLTEITSDVIALDAPPAVLNEGKGVPTG